MILYTLLAVNLLLTFFMFRRLNVIGKQLNDNQHRIANAVTLLAKAMEAVADAEDEDEGQ